MLQISLLLAAFIGYLVIVLALPPREQDQLYSRSRNVHGRSVYSPLTDIFRVAASDTLDIYITPSIQNTVIEGSFTTKEM